MAKRDRFGRAAADSLAALDGEVTRRIALRFLRRAVQGAAREQARMRRGLSRGAAVVGIKSLQVDHLWKVVVAASHKSGKF